MSNVLSSWWQTLSLKQKVGPIFLVLSYWAALFALKGFRGDHLTFGLVILILYYAGPFTQRLFAFVFPYLLVGILYDSQRFYADYLRGPVHVSEPYQFDKVFFGINTAQGVLTPNEWWQLHTHPVLDFITGFAYLVFFAVYILISVYFVFYLGRKGTSKWGGKEIITRARLMPWAFLWLNLLGWSTYYWYAAAPPWYVALHGLGPAKMDTPANQAGCIRFDQLLGTHFFSEMYGRAADVFGAIPSLHIAYPLLAVYFAFWLGAGRIFCILFYLVMCFSAVYLNHHYILDIIWGSAYAVLIGWIFSKIAKNQAEQLKNGVSKEQTA